MGLEEGWWKRASSSANILLFAPRHPLPLRDGPVVAPLSYLALLLSHDLAFPPPTPYLRRPMRLEFRRHATNARLERTEKFDIIYPQSAVAEYYLPDFRARRTAMQWVEDKVRAILNPFIDSDIQLSVWQGDLTLRNVQLRVEALDELDLDLPMKVHGAFAGKIHVSLPLRALFGKQPISVTIDQLYIVAGGFSELDDAADLGMDNAEALAEKQRKVKRAVIDAWQVMQDKFKPPGSIGQRATVVDRLASWLISRIRIDIRNVHVRLQEALSDLSGSHAGAAAEGRTASEPQLVLGCVLKSLRLDELPPEEVVHARPRSEVVQQPERRDGGGEGSGEGEGEGSIVAAVVGLRLELLGLAVYARVDEDVAALAEAHLESGTTATIGGTQAATVAAASASSGPNHLAFDGTGAAGGGAAGGAGGGGAAAGGEGSSATAASRWTSRMQPMIDSCPSDDLILRPLGLRLSMRAVLRDLLKGTRVKGELRILEGGLHFGVRHAQMLWLLALGEALAFKARRHAHRQCYRPSVTVLANPSEWWRYVGRCGLLAHRSARRHYEANRLSWATFVELRRRRLEYVRAYEAAASNLRTKRKPGEPPPHDVVQLEGMEDVMELHSIFSFRALAVQVIHMRRDWKSQLASWTGFGSKPEPIGEVDIQAALAMLEEEADAEMTHEQHCSEDFVQVNVCCGLKAMGRSSLRGATIPLRAVANAPFARARARISLCTLTTHALSLLSFLSAFSSSIHHPVSLGSVPPHNPRCADRNRAHRSQSHAAARARDTRSRARHRVPPIRTGRRRHGPRAGH